MKRSLPTLVIASLLLLIGLSSCGPWMDIFGPDGPPPPDRHEQPHGGPGHGGYDRPPR